MWTGQRRAQGQESRPEDTLMRRERLTQVPLPPPLAGMGEE